MLRCFTFSKTEPALTAPSPYATVKKKPKRAIRKLQREVVADFPEKQFGPLLKDLALLRMWTSNKRSRSVFSGLVVSTKISQTNLLNNITE